MTDQKRPRGRPPTGFDKKAYDKEYQRKRRAALRLLTPSAPRVI